MSTKVKLAIQSVTTAGNLVCGLCEQEEPMMGLCSLGVFVAGTSTPVCWECADAIDGRFWGAIDKSAENNGFEPALERAYIKSLQAERNGEGRVIPFPSPSPTHSQNTPPGLDEDIPF